MNGREQHSLPLGLRQAGDGLLINESLLMLAIRIQDAGLSYAQRAILSSTLAKRYSPNLIVALAFRPAFADIQDGKRKPPQAAVENRSALPFRAQPGILL